MKVVLIFIIIHTLFLCPFKAVSQNFHTIDNIKYTCHYKYDFQADSNIVYSRKTVDMCLHIGSHYSKFEHSSYFLKDSLSITYGHLPPEEGAIKAMPQLMGNKSSFLTFYSIIKPMNKNQVELYEMISKTSYMVREDILYQWQLKNVADTLLLGYHCKVATTEYAGRNYKAWYTTDIPISEGPYKFKGLPGLIIKIEDSQRHHCFELTSIQTINYDKPLWHKDKNYKQINTLDYIKAKKADINRLISELSTRLKTASPEKLGKIEAMLRSRNNFIERL